MSVNTNIVRIPSKSKHFFRYWFEFLRPFHKLTDREIDVITALVQERFNLSKVIFDEDLLDQVVLGEETRKKIMEECNLKYSHFQIIMGKLRANKLIINNKINRKYIPNIEKDAKGFKLVLYFDIKDDDI